MITKRKNDEVIVFSGTPWEVERISKLLSAAYIKVSVEDIGRKEIKLSVPGKDYTAAMRVIAEKLN